MGEMEAKGKVKRAQIEATVIRADGTRHELGVISDSAKHWNLLGRWLAQHKINRANKAAKR